MNSSNMWELMVTFDEGTMVFLTTVLVCNQLQHAARYLEDQEWVKSLQVIEHTVVSMNAISGIRAGIMATFKG